MNSQQAQWLRQPRGCLELREKSVLKKILFGLFVLLLLCWLYLAFVGVEPKDRRPGTLLSGEDAALPADWSFVNQTDSAGEVHLETYPWYGIPFSVTTVIAENNGSLFIPSLYSAVLEFPGDKFWNKVVASDPSVRLRVAGKLYTLAIHPVSDAAGFDQGLQALARKYPFWAKKLDEQPQDRKYVLLQLTPRA